MNQQVNKFTERLPHPAEFPVGSVESRAAARAQLAEIENRTRKRQIILDMPRRGGEEGGGGNGVGPWWPDSDGGLVRVIVAPVGEMSKDELQRLLATP